ncbi:extracellular solute-binding protein family 1 [Beutenbergia cavernae DSM 12333]|uniref:Extracellular solute-binding protein family 1 n=1 Tax=Beutenbergia cavernae (strain ATCC BAA-8 / DSM 12333 / CCUG 43141 / JCM 11478 / NBRC 16432 / NCIMB 13614 / HKI 0122) TaxID=471853 RepID=C5BXF2_BEUC1|nr:extracellular solute-binding protein [Beutenbergia cavernae]ACQ80835.1 extracellular solute-binding protein family 1 [Beutenbergia cavernae DSM 12333]
MTATTSRPRARRRALTAIAGTLALGAALAACAPGSGGESPTTADGEDGEVVTDLASLGDVTLRVWDQEVRGGQNEQIEQLNAAFMEAYPNITIDRTSQSFDDLETTLRGALSGNEAPDVVQANNARGTMGAFVEADLLLDLDPYADAYGWRDRFPESVLAKSSYSDDARTFGEGSLYGLPQVGEIVGVFYSKAKLEAIGVDPASLTTWQSFTDALGTAAGAGEVAVQLGNLDAWPAIHVFGPIQGQLVPTEEVTALGLGNPGASWETDENVAAAAELQGWADEGYFNDGPNGTDYDAAWQSFTEGQGAFLVGGSWLAADMEAAMGDDLGFFAPPPPAEGDPLATTGGTGLPFAVTAQSPNAAAAAGYVDFITSDDAMEVIAETGNMPVLRTAELAPADGVNAEIFAAFDEVSTNGALLPYLDYATPTMGDTLGAALQDLLGGQITPEEFTQALQADYGAFTEQE